MQRVAVTYQDYNRAMTEKPSDIDPSAAAADAEQARASFPESAEAGGVSSASSAAAHPDPAAKQPDRSEPVTPPNRKSVKGLWFALVLLVALASALAAALWYQQQEFDRLGRDLVSRIDGVTASAETARRDANQALVFAQSQTAAVTRLQTSLAEIRTQYQALQEAWDLLDNGSGRTALLNDIEQLLNQANQQLRLGGHVSHAIIALEIAQSRLAHANRPELTSLQQVIDHDLSSLRAVPLIDMGALAARIDHLIELIARAPLLAPDAGVPVQIESSSTDVAAPPIRAVQPEGASWWQRLRGEVASWPQRALNTLSHEMRDLISIRRVDDANALLLAPEQAAQLRATLRMRLLTAQVALLMRQPAVWQSELTTVGAALAANYDARSVDTMTAVQIARELIDLDVVVALPGLDESLKAIAALRNVAGASSSEEE